MYRLCRVQDLLSGGGCIFIPAPSAFSDFDGSSEQVRMRAECKESALNHPDVEVGIDAQFFYCDGSKVAVVARKEMHRDLIEKKWGLKLINSQNGDVIEQILEYFGRLPDKVYEDTGNPEVIKIAVKATAPGGKLSRWSDRLPVRIVSHRLWI